VATVSLNLRRPGYLLAAAIVLQVALISAQVNTGKGVPLLEAIVFGGFAEVQRGSMAVVDGVSGIWTGYFNLRGVQAENAELKQRLQELQVRLQEERASAQRADRFRHLLELRERTSVKTTAAEVIAAGASPEFRTMTIDKGQSDGLALDMAVIAPEGVVGRVILPGARASKIQLLIDRNAAAGALIERSRAQGVVVGIGNDQLQMEYVPSTADVKTGDVVVTSGIDGIYPKGFVIGTVDRVERGPGVFHAIAIRPAVDFSRLEEVLVVLTPPPAQPTEGGEGRE
jgi:rod shape-determining protein MreC